MRKRLSVAAVVTVILTAAFADAQTRGDWYQGRGAARDAVASFAPPVTWPQQLTKRWEITVGAGHSSPVVAGDRVIIHAREGEQEITRAIDLNTGKEVWRSTYAAPYTMNPAARAHGPGPKSTPVI